MINSIQDLPAGSTTGIAAVVLLFFCCIKWKCGPLFVLQVWIVTLRAFLQWLMWEAVGGITSRWPRFHEIRERIQRGEKSGRQQRTTAKPNTITNLNTQSESI